MNDRTILNPTTERVIRTGIRSIAASIPAAASISHAWNEWETNLRFTRLEDFFLRLHQQIERRQNELEALSEELREPWEVAPVLERAARAAQIEPSENRLETLAGCLVELLLRPDWQLGEKLNMIEHLDHLTEQDLYVFLRIQGEGAWFNNLYKTIDVPGDSRMTLLTSSLSKLAARGLICGVPRKDAHCFDVATDKITATYSSKYFAVLPAGEFFRDGLLAGRAGST